MNDLRRIVAFLFFLGPVLVLVVFGPLLLAFAIGWPKREGQHPLPLSIALVALAFYGLKRLAVPRASRTRLPLGA